MGQKWRRQRQPVREDAIVQVPNFSLHIKLEGLHDVISSLRDIMYSSVSTECLKCNRFPQASYTRPADGCSNALSLSSEIRSHQTL